MFKIWIRILVATALFQLGMNAFDLRNCRNRECFMQMHQKMLKVVEIDWKPISVWPEEAKRFRKQGR